MINNPGGAPLSAMVQGSTQGQQNAARILPSVYQAQGKSAPQNPWQGPLDQIVDTLLSLGQQIKNQGEQFRAEGEELYGHAYDIAKLSRKLTQTAQEGQDSNAQ